LIHPSYRHENPLKGLANFDRLEFFGDAILNFVICRKIFRVFPDADEGILSRLRSILVSRKILYRIAVKLKLGSIIKVGRSLMVPDDASRAKILSDTFEALIAAVYFDKGFEATERFVLKCYAGYFDMRKLWRLDPNPKSSLQELVQKHWRKLPLYTYELRPDGGARVTIVVLRSLRAAAAGRNRREAEEKAARLLIQKIRQVLVRRSKK